MSFMEDSIKIEKILYSLMKQHPQIKKILLIDKEGLYIKGVSREGKKEEQQEMFISEIAPLSSAMHTSAEMHGNGLGMGNLLFEILEFEHGFIVSKGLKNAIINIYTDKTERDAMIIVLMKIMQAIRKKEEELCEVLENYGCIDLGEVNDLELKDEMRALLTKELESFRI